MAVVVGLRCKEGLVVCANRQMSAPSASKSYERRLTIERSQSILFAYAGQPSLAREAREKISEKIGQAQMPSSLLYLAADEVLADLRGRNVELDLQVLIGISAASEEPALFMFDGKALRVADEFNFLGVGDSSLLRFLAAMKHSLELNIDELASLAVDLLRKAEGYIEPSGGHIDIAIMKSGNQSCRLILEEDVQRIIRKLEEQGSVIHLSARGASS